MRTPTLSIKKCPRCGHEVELFSIDRRMVCDKCGFVIYSEVTGCIKWCQYAKECLGEDLYRKLVGEDRNRIEQ